MIVKANAKINLSLDITGKKEDGYHTICSVMQSVSLCDTIKVSSAKGIEVLCDKEELSGENNLCVKAARLFFEKSGIEGGVRIGIEKHIPIAGGLGGGSADAAAVLVALNKTYGEPLNIEELLKIALTLGADVPFCVVGGTKLAEGIGEELTTLPDLPDCFIVIAKKGVKSSTGDMYRAIDRTTPKRVSDVQKIKKGLAEGNIPLLCEALYNRFEEVSEQSILQEAKKIMGSCNALYCGLSGAGPSVIGIFDKISCAESAATSLQKNGFLTFICRPSKEVNQIFE